MYIYGVSDFLSSALIKVSPNQSNHESSVNEPEYKDAMMKRALLFTVVLMAITGSTLTVVGVERLIRGRFTFLSMVRFMLSFTFTIFLPIMSYMSRVNDNDRALLFFVILWMLLVEVIRKKVEVMVRSAGGGSFSRATNRFKLTGHSVEFTRLVWIGYIIYNNISSLRHSDVTHHTVVISVVVILWSLVLAKLGQRVFNEWKAQDSLAAGGNTHFVAGYMQHILEKDLAGNAAGRDADALETCQYLVMGEEKLVLNKKERAKLIKEDKEGRIIFTPGCGHGVGKFPHDQNELKHVHLLVNLDDDAAANNLVTVQKIWRKFDSPCCKWLYRFFGSKSHDFLTTLRLLCVSFSFFKLLRRRFEHYPMVEVGSDMAKRVMLKGLLTHSKDPEMNAWRTFEVLRLELDFLDNYYQGGVPIVMSSPWLFFVNYLFSILFVWIYLIAVVLILLDAKIHLKSMLYLVVSFLLAITLLAIEFTELLTDYLLSNWFLVHLLCLLSTKRSFLWKLLCGPVIWCFILGRFLVFSALKLMLWLTGRSIDHDRIKVKQVSILRVCEPIYKLSFSWAPTVKLPIKAKEAFVASLKDVLEPASPAEDEKRYAILPKTICGFDITCAGQTCTQVILVCHLASELLEIESSMAKKSENKTNNKKERKKKGKDDDWHQLAATALSRYCMYLVARKPELLPDNDRWVTDRYDDLKSFLEEESRRQRYCCCCASSCRLWRCRCWLKVMDTMRNAPGDEINYRVAKAGVDLFKKLKTDDSAWTNLKDFWVQMVVYLSPSNDVESHAMALASSGGDLITYLWAFCTHAGIMRKVPLGPQHADAEPGGSGTGIKKAIYTSAECQICIA
ncbi:hypothetical protein GUJ93_ZPchr0007g4752 [Zizania palustris]|uniref:DUF4220 domain-containing protein n=1 Tax=Zizania palustris TaxID=103762 RepID=A0A8J5T6G8_ZIZPA|nr:hypothetical protein GUJ93_ZPchr0007g4752 [Zizania palustris]